MEDRTKIYKIIILGDGAVGKTTLRKRYFGDKFQSQYMMTIGADFSVKKAKVDERDFVLQIWDLAGQPRFKEIRETYYKNSSGMILVFDVSIRSSFENLPKWLDEFSANFMGDVQDVPIILVGNKIDLRGEPGLNILTSQEAMEYSQKLSEWSNHDVPYVETSALVGVNVEVPFSKLIKNLEKSFRSQTDY